MVTVSTYLGGGDGDAKPWKSHLDEGDGDRHHRRTKTSGDGNREVPYCGDHGNTESSGYRALQKTADVQTQSASVTPEADVVGLTGALTFEAGMVILSLGSCSETAKKLVGIDGRRCDTEPFQVQQMDLVDCGGRLTMSNGGVGARRR